MKKNLLSLLFIVLTLVIILVLAFSNSELTNAWDVLFTLDLKWVFCALLGWGAYMFFDMASLYYFLRKEKQNITLRYTLYVTLIGFYYSNITPGASGGQPLQVYYLSKRGVPVPIGTSAISIKFFAQQLMLVLMTTVLWLSNRGFINTQLASAKWAIYIGYAINFAAIPLILLVALHRPMVQAMIGFFVRLGAKMRLVKHPEEQMLRISAGLDTYHGEQIPYLHGALDRLRLRIADRYPLILKPVQIIAHRGDQIQFAALRQRHGGGGGHRLGQ